MIGQLLGPYQVLSKLGAGGMGEVYRAHNTKLNRDVAIKVLPEAFALDADTVLDARPPTLRQALEWAEGRAILELDVKRGVPYEDVLAEVRSAGALTRVVFITYSDDAAVRVHKLAPQMMLSVSMDEPRDINVLERRGIDLTRVLAWTGTETPNPSLNHALAARGIEKSGIPCL